MAVAFEYPARRPGLTSIPNGLSWAYPRVRRRVGRVEGGGHGEVIWMLSMARCALGWTA